MICKLQCLDNPERKMKELIKKIDDENKMTMHGCQERSQFESYILGKIKQMQKFN